ncbi:MAG: hypothetical protein J0I84_04905 [Terrimonas sp.]|nr:hypothetical protein [Terrimonas sp.]OJY88951.1 MAG: hypothetical protein BGP13_02755 [Sphingobacteriales bacterium 40-81]
MKHILYTAIISLLIFSSCKKDNTNEYNSNNKGELSIEFDNIVGGENLALNTGSYTNSSGETYKITTLKYFISNISLGKADGTTYTVPQNDSYFLIEEGNEDADHASIEVPEGEYKTLTFMVGIDSLRNTKDVSERTGALDPAGTANGMYWGWNSGYIFFKIEGTSTASTADGNMFMYHIGGFGGYSSSTINNIKTVTLNLEPGGTPKVHQGKETNIHLMVDIAKLFDNKSHISIAEHAAVMFDAYSTTIADNYATMFRHDHTEN